MAGKKIIVELTRLKTDLKRIALYVRLSCVFYQYKAGGDDDVLIETITPLTLQSVARLLQKST